MSIPIHDPFYYDRLSDREKDVIRAYLKTGKTALVAEELFISIKTVEAHRKHIFEVLEVDNMIHMVLAAIKDEWIQELIEWEQRSPGEYKPREHRAGYQAKEELERRRQEVDRRRIPERGGYLGLQRG